MRTAKAPRRAALAFALALLPAAVAAQTPDERDLQALRFYISENNEQAIQSEMRRLQLQFPGWTPPDDLDVLQRDVPGEVIDEIYRLIADEDYQGARDKMEETNRLYPDWSPSTELLETLSLSEAQSEFTAAVEAGNAQAAIRIARASPSLLRCERVNNAWLLADQYKAVDDPAAAMIVYRGIADSCADADMLTATLEKSADIATVAQLSELADTMRGQVPAAAERLTAVENRLRAGLDAGPRAVTGDGALPAPVPGSPAVTGDGSGAVIASLRPAPRPEGLSDRRRATPAPRQAGPAGTTSRASSGGAGSGLSRSLQSAADRGDWRGCLALSANATRPDAVSQRGWCAFNAGRPMQALRDFRDAANRGGTAVLRRDSRYGLALTMMRLNMVDQAAAVAASTDFTRDQRLEVESEILDARGVAAFQRGDYRRAIAYFDELERLTGRVRRDLAMLRGYAYMNSGQRNRAVEEFRRLHGQLATPETRRALSAALQ